MQLRPFAPLAVIGAGLLVMTMATYPASAEAGGAPADVVVTPVGSDLLVSWQAPDSTAGLTEYDLVVTAPDSGKRILERTAAVDATQVRLAPSDLSGATDLVVTVVSEYGQSTRYSGTSVRVALPTGPVKPETPPALRVEGGALKVTLPAAVDGSTGRIVRLYRDGVQWKVVSLKSARAGFTRAVAAGHDYAAAYQEVSDVAAGPFSEQSEAVSVKASGPLAVKKIKLKATEGGLQVRWSTAVARGAGVEGYRVKVVKDGARVGSAFTAAAVRTVVLPGAVEDGAYSVTITATDAAGGTSSSTSSIAPKG